MSLLDSTNGEMEVIGRLTDGSNVHSTTELLWNFLVELPGLAWTYLDLPCRLTLWTYLVDLPCGLTLWTYLVDLHRVNPGTPTSQTPHTSCAAPHLLHSAFIPTPYASRGIVGMCGGSIASSRRASAAALARELCCVRIAGVLWPLEDVMPGGGVAAREEEAEEEEEELVVVEEESQVGHMAATERTPWSCLSRQP